MSKSVILLIVFIAAICSAEVSVPKKSDLFPRKQCTPGSTWQSQCNSCSCTAAGLAICTIKMCTGNEPDPIRECAPGTTWKNSCNTCVCPNGKAACTLMECTGITLPTKSELLSKFPKLCAPGSSWKSQCNDCMCTSLGLPACTQAFCEGYESDPKKSCAPGTTWKNDCNTCVCNDGKAACTLMACGK